MPDDTLPTRDEIAKLYKYSQVEFAECCARLARPYFLTAWPDAPEQHVRAVEDAISATRSLYCDPETTDDAEVRAFNAEVTAVIAAAGAATAAARAATRPAAAAAAAAVAAAVSALGRTVYFDDSGIFEEAVDAVACASEAGVSAGDIRLAFDKLLHS